MAVTTYADWVDIKYNNPHLLRGTARLFRCTCIRGENLTRLILDPDCPAPSHLYDQINEAFAETPVAD